MRVIELKNSLKIATTEPSVVKANPLQHLLIVKTLGDCQKKIEDLGILKPEYSLNNIEQAIAYNINAAKDTLKTRERINKWLTKAEQILLNTENIKTRGNKND